MQADNPGAEVSEIKDLGGEGVPPGAFTIEAHDRYVRDGWERFERIYTVDEVKAKLQEHAGSWLGDGPGPWTDAGTLTAYGPLAAVRELWLADVWSAGYATARDMKAITRDATDRFASFDDTSRVEVRGWVHRKVRVAPAPTIIGSWNAVEAGRRRIAAEVAQERHAEQAAKAGTADAPPVVSPKDVPPPALLDLVRQYGQARWSEGTELDGGTSWREARTEADFQFDRIAALVPQPAVESGCTVHCELLDEMADILDIGPFDDMAEALRYRLGEPEPEPRAKVGDVIEHGQPIPANVVRMTDAQGYDRHVRGRGLARRIADGSMLAEWFPMTVAEVDPEPQPAETSLLDLVRQYGDARRSVGYCDGRNFDTGNDLDKASALFERITALVPQQPVQARDNHGDALWIHGCGHVVAINAARDDVGRLILHRHCTTDVNDPWRPLLVGGDPAHCGPGISTVIGDCPSHGLHPHRGATCLDCPICRPPAPPVVSTDLPLHSARLLELVRDYGLQEREDGGSTRDPRSRAAEAMFNDIVRLIRFGTPQPPVVSPEGTPAPPAVVAAEPSSGPGKGVGNPQTLSEALRWLPGLEGRYNERVTKLLDSGKSVNDPTTRYLMGKADGVARVARVFEAIQGRTQPNLMERS